MFYCDFWNNFHRCEKEKGKLSQFCLLLDTKGLWSGSSLGTLLGEMAKVFLASAWEVSDSSRGSVPDVTCSKVTAGASGAGWMVVDNEHMIRSLAALSQGATVVRHP